VVSVNVASAFMYPVSLRTTDQQRTPVIATSKHTAPYSAHFPGAQAAEGSTPPRWRVVGQDTIYFETPSQEEAWRYCAQLYRCGYTVRVERVPATIAQNPATIGSPCGHWHVAAYRCSSF